ncbi:hypothetical protein [Crateriforma conspicua]|nr:hypothetical protein [Crateriforma conspicua]
MIALVHLFIIYFDIPTPAAWWIGAMIYSGLVAVLFSSRSLAKKLSTYAMFGIVTWVGWLTVCPCTFAHFLFAPVAGLIALITTHAILSRILPSRVAKTDGG